MDGEPIEAVRNRRAARATGFVVGAEHEMIDEKLRTSSEEIREGNFSFVSLEAVILFDFNPRQFLSLPRQLVTASRLFLLGLEQLQSGREPLFMCSSFMLRHSTCLLRSRSASAAWLQTPANVFRP